MKRMSLTTEEINKIDPNNICVSLWVGSDDILVQSGKELIECALKENATLIEALDEYLEDKSGNSFEIIAIHNNELVIVNCLA